MCKIISAMYSLIGLSSLLVVFFMVTGCIPYKYPTSAYSSTPEEFEAAHSWLYAIVPRHRSQIHWYDIGHWCSWAVFGNDDDGLFGEAPKAHFQTGKPANLSRALAWHIRNPLHNFCFYVIGQAHRRNSGFTLLKLGRRGGEVGRYRPVARHVFAEEDTSLNVALHGWKPFISIRLQYTDHHRGDFYFGWRERGNFGIKCQLLKRGDRQTMDRDKG